MYIAVSISNTMIIRVLVWQRILLISHGSREKFYGNMPSSPPRELGFMKSWKYNMIQVMNPKLSWGDA